MEAEVVLRSVSERYSRPLRAWLGSANFVNPKRTMTTRNGRWRSDSVHSSSKRNKQKQTLHCAMIEALLALSFLVTFPERDEWRFHGSDGAAPPIEDGYSGVVRRRRSISESKRVTSEFDQSSGVDKCADYSESITATPGRLNTI